MSSDISECWSLSTARVCELLRTSSQGLTDAEAARRLAGYGANVVTPSTRASAWRPLAAQFTSPVTVLLLVAAVLSLGLGERADGTIILSILVVLVVRTRRTFFRSRPSTALFWLSVVVGWVAVALPHSPLASLLGFAPLPMSVLAIVAGIVALYVAGSEVTKRLFLHRSPW